LEVITGKMEEETIDTMEVVTAGRMGLVITDKMEAVITGKMEVATIDTMEAATTGKMEVGTTGTMEAAIETSQMVITGRMEVITDQQAVIRAILAEITELLPATISRITEANLHLGSSHVAADRDGTPPPKAAAIRSAVPGTCCSHASTSAQVSRPGCSPPASLDVPSGVPGENDGFQVRNDELIFKKRDTQYTEKSATLN